MPPICNELAVNFLPGNIRNKVFLFSEFDILKNVTDFLNFGLIPADCFSGLDVPIPPA
jgi:hypothetical protein